MRMRRHRAGVTVEECHAAECHSGKWSRDSSRIPR